MIGPAQTCCIVTWIFPEIQCTLSSTSPFHSHVQLFWRYLARENCAFNITVLKEERIQDESSHNCVIVNLKLNLFPEPCRVVTQEFGWHLDSKGGAMCIEKCQRSEVRFFGCGRSRLEGKEWTIVGHQNNSRFACDH
jgi:hypothetical protein